MVLAAMPAAGALSTVDLVPTKGARTMKMTSNNRCGRGALPALALAAAVLAGCGGNSVATKAGGSGAPVILRIGTDDTPGRPAAKQIEEFARQVQTLSAGTVRIEPVWQAAGQNPDDWDQKVARMVAGGELDMGMIPSRSWDTEGVTSLRALSAPFLITSDRLAGQIATDEIANQMLAGLDKAGVVGLALVPEGLRHPFAFKKPLRGPGDYRGATVRSPRSDTVYAVFRALGATADDLPGAAFAAGVRAGTVAAAETSFAFAGLMPARAVVTGNVTLFPKINSLVVNTEAFDKLRSEQQEAMRTAATRTRDWAIANNDDDGELAKAFCNQGGRIVAASEADVKALTLAVTPVYTQLEQDPQTKAVIERARSLRQQIPVSNDQISPCNDTTGPAAPGDDGGDTAAPGAPFPEGVYRADLPADYLVSKGLTEDDAFGNGGIQTLTFKDGRFLHETDSPANPQACGGTFAVEAERVVLNTDAVQNCGTAAGDMLFSATWVLKKGELHFAAISSGGREDSFARAYWGAKPWKKIR